MTNSQGWPEEVGVPLPADEDRSGFAATRYGPGRSGKRGRARGMSVRGGRLEAVLTITPDELLSVVVNVAQNGWSLEEGLQSLGFALPAGLAEEPKGGRRRKGGQPAGARSSVMEQMYEDVLREAREQVERDLERRTRPKRPRKTPREGLEPR
jgi:hypothetical protein